MNHAVLQTQLQLPYSLANWRALLPDLFPGTDLFTQPVDFPLTNEREREIATARRQFGVATLADGKRVAFYEIDVARKVEMLRNRVALRDLIARCIDQVSAHAVLAFFIQPGQHSYRLTYASKESRFADDLKVDTKETARRRFTYILGPSEACRTAALRLASLAQRIPATNLADVTEAFSVERLNREFFDTYKLHYQKFCTHLIDRSETPTTVFGLTLRGLDAKARDQALKPVRDFVKKLLGRLVFLHFLQKKGWLGCPADTTEWGNGDTRFLHELFASASADDQAHFHSQRLVPLFFDTLNRYREGDLFSITGTRVPYLNGGLFERDFTNVDQIEFPAELFRDLLEFFAQYNFTIDENDPEDHEIGIDPEMLGHIFENLLEDNKDKGAFYTPKAIVQYMCQQSLISYLKQHLGDRPEIETLVRRKDVGDPADSKNWIRQNARQIEGVLDKVKICDPAIGSGAFPIGLLQEIYWLKISLDWTLDRAKAKRDIIQHSIYGVDLDAGAVEIARLRFWLALVVEEKEPRPLPNLDYKIMQGNSLLESFEGIDLSNLTGSTTTTVQPLGTPQGEFGGYGFKDVSTELTVEFADGKQAEITNLISSYFDQDDPEKKRRLHRQIDDLVLGHIEFNLGLHQKRVQDALEDARKDLKRKQAAALTYEPTKREAGRIVELETQLRKADRKRIALNALQAKPERPFFLWHLFFQDAFAHGGFDIMIANPPYGAEISEGDAPTLTANFEVAGKGLESFAMFIELGIKLITKSGTICMIVPTGWYSGNKSWALRRFLATAANPRSFLMLPYDIFEEAWVDTTIFIAQKRADRLEWPRRESCIVSLKSFPKRFKPTGVGDFLLGHHEVDMSSWFTDESDEFLTLTTEKELRLLKKIRRNSNPLGKISDVQRGVTPFHLTELPEHTNSQPAFHGTIRRYMYEKGPTRYIRYDESLAEFKPAKYFHGRRILMRELISRQFRLQAMLVDEDFVTNKSMQSILATQGGPDIRVLLGIINSKLISWYFLSCSNIAHRDDFPKIVLDETRSLPIPEVNQTEATKIINMVDQLIAAKRAEATSAVQLLESEIDSQVFDLFKLTPEEIDLVEASIVASNPADAKSIFFKRVLPDLRATLPYFTTAAITQRARDLGLEIKDATLPVYITEAAASSAIYDAGRGWYSRFSQRVPLDTKLVTKLIRAVEKAFPLLDFTVWSTAQINPWMHHLLAQPVAFLYAPVDTLETISDTLRAQGWDVAVNPAPSAGPRSVRPGEKMVVLRPTMSKQPAGEGRQAPIEKILVDLVAEAPRLALMDTSEAQGVATTILNQFLVQIAVLQRYADSRAIKLTEVEAINQRQSNASIGVS